MDRLIPLAELRLRTGVTDNDAGLEFEYRTALERLYRYLNVSSLLTHAVTDERVRVSGDCIFPRDFPAVTSGMTVKDLNSDAVTGYTFGRFANDNRKINILDSSGDPTTTGYNEWLLSYTAGYTATASLTVVDYAALVGKTLNVYADGTLAVWSFVASGATDRQIVAATSNNTTATAIASALGGTASGATVSLPDGTSVELGSADASDITITPSSLPDAFKACLAALVSAGLAEKQKAKGISSYTVGSKSVTYAANTTQSYADILSEHVSDYRLPHFASA